MSTAEMYYQKGKKYLEDKKYAKANENFDKAIKKNARYAAPWNSKGIISQIDRKLLRPFFSYK